MDFTLWYQRPFMDFMHDDRMSLPFMFGGSDYISYDTVSWCLHSLNFLLRVVQSGFCVFEIDSDNLADIVEYMLRTADKEAIEESEESRLKYRMLALYAWENFQLMPTKKLENLIHDTWGNGFGTSAAFRGAVSEEFSRCGVGFEHGSFFVYEHGVIKRAPFAPLL